MATELSPPKGHGLVRVAHNLRRHVGPNFWATDAATDFWLSAGQNNAVAAAAATSPIGLSGWGWTTTTLTSTAGVVGGDFLSPTTPGTPSGISMGADTDLLQSPCVFGSYSHGLQVGQILGHYPTKLVVETYAAFTTNSANETRTGFGLTEAAGTAGTAADAMAWIHTDGTNFTIRSGADSDVGALDDALYHTFRIVFSVGTTDAIEWFIDGTSQGTMDNQAALWPCSYGAYASTTNRIVLSWAHLWYE